MGTFRKDIPHMYISGMPIHKLRMSDVLDHCDGAIAERKNIVLGMVNVAKLISTRKDPELFKSVCESDLIVADGQGIVWLSRWIKQPLPERIAGIDIMYELMKRASEKKYRVYFLGAKASVVKTVAEKACAVYPGLQVAGFCDGYFDLEKDGKIVAEQIRESRADILFVAITPPKKEIFMDRWKNAINVPVCHGVGGSFDVFAGVVMRAPRWMQKAGLEWFYRLLQEPRRMWKRYLITNTRFLGLAVTEIISAHCQNSQKVKNQQD